MARSGDVSCKQFLYPALTTGLKPQGNADEIGAEAESCVPPKVGGIRTLTVRLTAGHCTLDAVMEVRILHRQQGFPFNTYRFGKPESSASPMEEATSSKGVQVSVRIRRGALVQFQQGREYPRASAELNIILLSPRGRRYPIVGLTEHQISGLRAGVTHRALARIVLPIRNRNSYPRSP